MAEAFAAAGDTVAVHHRDSPEQAAAVLASLPGAGHVLVQADIRDPEAVRQMVDSAAEQLGGLNVLVNNAASYGRASHPVAEVSYAAWRQAWHDTIGLNLLGAANVTWVRGTAHDGGRRWRHRQRIVARRVSR